MLQFGLLTPEQYASATKKRRCSGSGVAFTLLETSVPPTEQEVQRFEEISHNLRTSNGTTRMTFRHRMPEVDELALRLMRQSFDPSDEIVVQDRAASTCLTSVEWAHQLLQAFPNARFEASDALLYLLRISITGGHTYIVEPSGQPLQYVKSPFVVCLCPREPLRYPLNHIVAAHAKRKFRKLALPQNLAESKNIEYSNMICCVHPEARSLTNTNPRFTICMRSVFDRTPGVDILRTMNVLNLAYFPTDQLAEGVRAAFCSVKPGGLWIVGRTHEQDSKNHVTFFRRTDTSWETLERIGKGSEIAELAIDIKNLRRNNA